MIDIGVHLSAGVCAHCYSIISMFLYISLNSFQTNLPRELKVSRCKNLFHHVSIVGLTFISTTVFQKGFEESHFWALPYENN